MLFALRSSDSHPALVHPCSSLAVYAPTAVGQFSYLNCIPAHCYLKPVLHQHFNVRSGSLLCSVLILLSGDIQVNPGPPASHLTIATLNVRSLFHPNRSVFIPEVIQTHNIDILALSETFQSINTTPAQLRDITPPSFQFFGQPRELDSRTSAKGSIGGGLGILICDAIKSTIVTLPPYTSFECLAIDALLPVGNLRLFNIYRPPDTSQYSTPFADFIAEFSSFLSFAATTPGKFLITGDFNIHVNDPSDIHASQFLSMLSSVNLLQHVTFPTHVLGNTLDLVITPNQSPLSPAVTCSPVSPSDHFVIITTLDISPPAPKPAISRSFRRINSIDTTCFIHDVSCSALITNPPTDIDALVALYNSTLTSVLDKHAPLRTKVVHSPKSNPWYTPAIQALKAARRGLERQWRSCKTSDNLRLLRNATNAYHKSLLAAKKLFYANLVESSRTNPRQLWKTINSILHRNPTTSSVPTNIPSASIAQCLASFFGDKIVKLQSAIPVTATSPHTPGPSFTPPQLTFFRPASVDEITRLILSSPNKQCESDPIPTSLLKQCVSVLAPVITRIVNASLASGYFPPVFKQSIVTPLLKKPTLDSDNLSNYRPISNLSFLSKLAERVVSSRLHEHLSQHSLFNQFQSAYTKFHSTETTLLALHDHLIRAMTHQQITCLCLLDLSAAFDTIDHAILLQRLSDWFGITQTAHSWLKSYLSSRSFTVSSCGSKSQSAPLLCGVPQGSVLGPLLFIMYTTPLSSLLSSTPVHHHLYADDTQLYISFSPHKYQSNISLLQSVFSKVSTWMSANQLSLNPSKTEFLLVGLSQQLAKVKSPVLSLDSNTSLQPVPYAKNLGFLIDSHLSFDAQISALSKACSYHIRDLRRIRSTLDYKTASTIATSLVQSKLDYCNSLYSNLPEHQLHRIQVLQNSLARAVTGVHRRDHISPALKSLHWLRVKERIQYKQLSLTYTALQFGKPVYLRNLLTLQSPRSTRSSSLVTLVRPPCSRLAIAERSFYYNIPSLWNSLPKHMRRPADPGTGSVLFLSRRQFLTQLKTHLFSQSFPS